MCWLSYLLSIFQFDQHFVKTSTMYFVTICGATKLNCCGNCFARGQDVIKTLFVILETGKRLYYLKTC